MDTSERGAALRGTASRWGQVFSRLLLAVLVLGGTSGGGVFGWRWLHTSPTFAIQQLSFAGLSRASEAELVKLAGIDGGQNLFALDLAQAGRAMATHPWVKKVELSRRFPRALSVQVEEHQPAAMLAIGELYLVDADGRPFRRVQPGDALELFLVTGVDRDGYVADAEESARKVASALAVARAYQASAAGKGGALSSALSEVRVEPEGGVSLVTRRGETVKLGEGDLEEKLSRLVQVRRELEARAARAEVIRLDNRARPHWVAVSLWDPVSERSGTR